MKHDYDNLTEEEKKELHKKRKKRIKTIGIVLLCIGIPCIVVGFVDFFIAMGSGMPKLFFLLFIGMPATGIGAGLTLTGSHREIATYYKNESAPIINELSADITPAVKNITEAVRGENEKIRCTCGQNNDKDTKFCVGCGRALKRECPKCGMLNEDVRYCKECGERLK